MTVHEWVTSVALPRMFAHPALLAGDSWRTHRALLQAAYGIVPTDPDDRAIILARTGRTTCPTAPSLETYTVGGRRSAKTRVGTLRIAAHATYPQYDQFLSPGERVTFALLASDRKQAGVAFGYVKGALEAIPQFAALIESVTADRIDLLNRVTIEVHTASFRSIRGYTIGGVVADELAFWDVDGANPDEEILAAIRPGLTTIPGSFLHCVSSPHIRRGELWNAYDQFYGRDDAPVLVIQGDSRDFNPTLDEAEIALAYQRDPQRAASEWGGQFRTDLERFVSREVIDAATVRGRVELPPQRGLTYAAFVDVSGGSGDAMTMAIGHRLPSERVVLDALREVLPPFDPAAVVREFAGLLHAYGVRVVHGDRYAGLWVVSKFWDHRIDYRHTDKDKSALYTEALALLNCGHVELLDVPKLREQFTRLERSNTRSGKSIVDHPPREHDDLANAASGLIAEIEKTASHGACIVFADFSPRGNVRPESSEAMRALRAEKRAIQESADLEMFARELRWAVEHAEACVRSGATVGCGPAHYHALGGVRDVLTRLVDTNDAGAARAARERDRLDGLYPSSVGGSDSAGTARAVRIGR